MKNGVMFLGCAAVVLAILYFFPWTYITWGKVIMSPERMVTVTGYAESKEKNQIANFSAGVSAVNDNKDAAVKDVNDKIKAITEAVKKFGVDASDIQTQSMSIYQRQESYYDNGTQKSRPGQWDVNNTILVTLRDMEKASAMADLLTKSGATNVNGPNFQLDTSKKATDALIEEAIANAQIKAEAMAKASGTVLDRIISVTEGSSSNAIFPLYAMGAGGGGGGAPVEPGSTNVNKTVVVVWSLK